MRTYSSDVFTKVRLDVYKSFGDLMFDVYKERLTKNLSNLLFHNSKRYTVYYSKLHKILFLNRGSGFFHYATAQRILDNETKKLSFYGYWLSQYKLFTNFYNCLSINVINRIWNKARTGRIACFNYFLCLLESRIDSLILRLNWVHCRHQIRQLLRERRFLVNDRPPLHPNVIINNFDFVTINYFGSRQYLKVFYKILRQKVRKHRYFARPPFFLEVNHKTLTAILVRKLMSRTQVRYPFRFSCEALMYIGYSKR